MRCIYKYNHIITDFCRLHENMSVLVKNNIFSKIHCFNLSYILFYVHLFLREAFIIYQKSRLFS